MLKHGGKTTSTSSYCSIQRKPIKDLNDNIIDYEPCPDENIKTYGDRFKGDFLTYNLNLAWAYNTLNRPMFPTKGLYHRLGLEAALPGSDVEYQKATYEGQVFFPLWHDFVLRGYTKLGYGNDLPFYKNFFAGGYGSVRGYDISSLGPRYDAVTLAETGQKDRDPEEVGGNALIQGGVELVIPIPSKSNWTRQIRPVLFAEGAQVFDTTTSKYDLDFNEMRYSVGAGFTWITMIGPLSLSYAYTLNDKAGDDTKAIQFEIGRTF